MAQSQFIFEDVCCLVGRTGTLWASRPASGYMGKMEKNMETTKGLEFGVWGLRGL